MSETPRQRAMAAGLLSIMPFQTRRASSYPWASGRMRQSPSLAPSVSSAARGRGLSEPERVRTVVDAIQLVSFLRRSSCRRLSSGYTRAARRIRS